MLINVLFVIIILIVLVFCINNLLLIFDYYKSKNIYSSVYWIENEFPDLLVTEISCSKSKCSFWPTIQNVVCHYDVICKCNDGNYYNITYCYPTLELRKKYIDQVKYDFKNWYIIQRVKLIKDGFRYSFKINGYKYKVKKFNKVNQPIKLDLVYQLVQNLLKLDWYLFDFNCHCQAKLVNWIVLEKEKFNLFKIWSEKNFELYKSDFKPLLFIKQVLNENFNPKSIWNNYELNI